jgi:tetratricopeptide (TPR) repeat protein
MVIFSYGLGFFAKAFPEQMAAFYDTVGNPQMAAMYHGRVYDKHKSPENLYYALSKSIDAQNNRAIIKYGDMWFASGYHYNRDRVTKSVDDYLMQTVVAQFNGDELAYVVGTVCNEDDRLRRKYIRALLETGSQENYEKAVNVFMAALIVDNLQSPSYAILEFSADPTLDGVFETYYINFSLRFYDVYSAENTDSSPLEFYKPATFVEFAMDWFNDARNAN